MFASPAAPKADYGFSERENEILHLLVAGMSKPQIATELGLSPISSTATFGRCT
jgi:DNA-binding NarL/FixJ family response regulator